VFHVFLSHQIRLYDDTHIRRIELMVHHSAIADKTAETQIPFDQRR
jgi:hypothetical protein